MHSKQQKPQNEDTTWNEARKPNANPIWKLRSLVGQPQMNLLSCSCKATCTSAHALQEAPKRERKTHLPTTWHVKCNTWWNQDLSSSTSEATAQLFNCWQSMYTDKKTASKILSTNVWLLTVKPFQDKASAILNPNAKTRRRFQASWWEAKAHCCQEFLGKETKILCVFGSKK